LLDISVERRPRIERRRLEGSFCTQNMKPSVAWAGGKSAHDFNNLLTAITGYSD